MNDILGNYFKIKENEMRLWLNPKLHTIVRLDGMRFHTFTHPFLHPLDPFLHYALESSLLKVLNKEMKGYYQSVYFQSDEASIVIPAIESEKMEMPFGGRVEKMIASLLQYNTYFYKELFTIYQNNLYSVDLDVMKPLYLEVNRLNVLKTKKDIRLGEYIAQVNYWIMHHVPSFDCRFIQVDAKEDIVKYLEWRRKDAIRNNKNNIARMFLSQKQMNEQSANEALDEVEKAYGVNYKDMPVMMKRGTIYRAEKYKDWLADGFMGEDDTTKAYQCAVERNVAKRDVNSFLNRSDEEDSTAI